MKSNARRAVRKTFVLCGLALTLAAGLAWADGEELPKTFSESTTVVVVEVPVTVHKDRLPVRGLTAENFEIREGGKRRELVGFEVVDLELFGAEDSGTGVAEPAAVPIAGRRFFLLLFDLSFTRPHSIAKAVDAARGLLDSLHPSDVVATGVFGTAGGARQLLGFTSDRRQVVRTLDVLDQLLDGDLKTPEEGVDVREDPLGLVTNNPVALAAEIGRAAGVKLSAAGQAVFDGVEMLSSSKRANGGVLLLEVLYGVEEDHQEGVRRKRRAEVQDLADSLSELAERTRGLEGRKYLVFFSEGFDDAVLHGKYSTVRSVKAAAAADTYTPGSGAIRVVQEMVDRFRRADWVIQAVDPAGARDRDYLLDETGLTNNGLTNNFDSSNGLAFFAYETGGEFYRSFNNLGKAMKGMLDKTSVTYLLSFQTEEIPLDGAFHPIKVSLKGAPRGAKLVHRPGYYAPEPFATVDEEATSFAIAQLILSDDDGGELDVAALVTEFKAEESKSGLAVWLEADGDTLLAGHGGEAVEADVFVYALDREGRIHDFFTKKVELDAVTAEATLTQGKLKIYGDLLLEPGRYRLRTLVRDAKSGRYGVGTVPVEVKPFSAAEVRLLEPILFDDPTRLYAAFRETETAVGTKKTESPFAFGSDAFFPAIRPTLSAGRDARFCLMAYHLFLEGMQMRAVVTKSDGSIVERDRLAVAGRAETSFDGLDRFFFDFRPQGLEPGEYTFQVAIGDPAAGDPAAGEPAAGDPGAGDPGAAAAYTASKRFRVVE